MRKNISSMKDMSAVDVVLSSGMSLFLLLNMVYYLQLRNIFFIARKAIRPTMATSSTAVVPMSMSPVFNQKLLSYVVPFAVIGLLPARSHAAAITTASAAAVLTAIVRAGSLSDLAVFWLCRRIEYATAHTAVITTVASSTYMVYSIILITVGEIITGIND